ncbi:MAG: uncharacterized protein JWM33_303 [Caulobacteraceae bacterium]|nr:uncharacterized protein [Caulobacteraceae bacterium]
MSALNPIGTKFLVNTLVAGNQYSGRLAQLDNGNLVATWITNTGSGALTSDRGVKAQVFDTSGAKLGGEISVDVAAVIETQPKAIALAGGGFLITWEITDAEGLHGQLFDASGTRLGSQFDVLDLHSGGDVFSPVIAPLADGGFVAAWDSSDRTNGSPILAQIFDATGSKVGAPFSVSSTVFANSESPKITSLSNGNFVVSWAASDHGQAPVVEAQLFDHTGAKLGGEISAVSAFDPDIQVPSQDVVALADGGFMVFRTDYSPAVNQNVVEAQRYDAAGAPVGGLIDLGAVGLPIVKQLSNGDLAMIWRANSQDKILIEAFDLNGETVGAVQQIIARTGENLTVNDLAALDNGQFAVSWTSSLHEPGGSGSAVYAELFGVADHKSFTGDADADRFAGTAGVSWDIDGQGGNDTLTGNSADDVISGGDGKDKLYGGDGHDTLYGGLGNDTLDGGAGADTLTGGADNDIYLVDNAGDVVVEALGEGNDTVKTSLLSFTIGANIEKLTANGAGDFTLTGNELANTLTGGAGADVLYGLDGKDHLVGGEGDDILFGGAGADTLTGGAGHDLFVFDVLGTAANKDTVADFVSGEDHLALSRAAFAAFADDAAGALDPSRFGVGAAAHTADQHLVYDPTIGALYYDADGSGSHKAVQIAVITGDPTLSAADFLLI